MKTFVIGIILLVFNVSLLAQNVSINCIVFVDGKLPTGISNTFFSISDSIGDETEIGFKYLVGEIQIDSSEMVKLNKLDPEAVITMYLTYKNYNGQSFNYKGDLRTRFLEYDYLVIRITNLNKKTGEYYFGYSTPNEIKKFIKKEYNMFEEFK